MDQFSVFFCRFFSFEALPDLHRNRREDRRQLAGLSFRLLQRLEPIEPGQLNFELAPSNFELIITGMKDIRRDEKWNHRDVGEEGHHEEHPR